MEESCTGDGFTRSGEVRSEHVGRSPEARDGLGRGGRRGADVGYPPPEGPPLASILGLQLGAPQAHHLPALAVANLAHLAISRRRLSKRTLFL